MIYCLSSPQAADSELPAGHPRSHRAWHHFHFPSPQGRGKVYLPPRGGGRTVVITNYGVLSGGELTMVKQEWSSRTPYLLGGTLPIPRAWKAWPPDSSGCQRLRRTDHWSSQNAKGQGLRLMPLRRRCSKGSHSWPPHSLYMEKRGHIHFSYKGPRAYKYLRCPLHCGLHQDLLTPSPLHYESHPPTPGLRVQGLLKSLPSQPIVVGIVEVIRIFIIYVITIY